MSTRSRPSFRRSLQSSFFRSASPTPSQASPPTTLSRSGTSTEKGRHAKREKVKEAIEQLFDKLHHHHQSQSSRVSHDARSSDSRSIGDSASQSSSRSPSVKHVKTNVSLVPYDLTEAQAELIAESSSRALRIDDVVIEIKQDPIPPSAPEAGMNSTEPELIQDLPTPVDHVRVSTETSVDVVIPAEELPVAKPDTERETPSVAALDTHTVDGAVIHCSVEEPTLAPILETTSTSPTIPEPSAPGLTTSSATTLTFEPSYTTFLAMIPYYPQLRRFLSRSRTRTAAEGPQKVSAGLLGLLFDNVFTRMAAFAFDMWLLSICFFLVKVLRVRPRVLKKVESWIP
ncbi:hypothetical protein BC629DRAFT_1538407 [Irpex lacteus]|nr:hypothetical protein BC629DRAFT_1538407 [Irpex lacteus]